MPKRKGVLMVAAGIAILAGAGAVILLRGKNSGVKVDLSPSILKYGEIANWVASGLTPRGKWRAEILGYGEQTIVLYEDAADQFGNAANRFDFSDANVPTEPNRLTVVDLTTGKSGSVSFTVAN